MHRCRDPETGTCPPLLETFPNRLSSQVEMLREELLTSFWVSGQECWAERNSAIDRASSRGGNGGYKGLHVFAGKQVVEGECGDVGYHVAVDRLVNLKIVVEK